MIPKKCFLTKGAGVHKDKIVSFELALEDAGIEKCNLVYVSSIFPPKCELIERNEGERLLNAGEITFCVMARNGIYDSEKTVSSAIGISLPRNREETNKWGYVAEYSSFDETEEKTGSIVEGLAKTMLLEKLGEVEVTSKAVVQSAKGDNKNNLWTTTVAVAVFIL